MNHHSAVSQLSRRATVWLLTVGVGAICCAILLGIFVVTRGTVAGLDQLMLNVMLSVRSAPFTAAALTLNFIGGGWFGVYVVPLAGGLVFVLRRRPWAALYLVLASALSAGVVQLLKAVFDRTRPPEILVIADPGSFPSGHVANAATLAVVLFLLLRRGWVWMAGAAYTILMMLSRTYLGAHWLSDTVGGVLIGVGVAVIVGVGLWRWLGPVTRVSAVRFEA
ncbi:MAG: phosphatase PAP2 family protein [Rhodoglobus sp.]